MKKITIIAVAALAVSFASCKKAKTCTCTASGTGWTNTDTYSYDKVSKGTANALCPKTRVYTDSNSGLSQTETCVLS